ncbi:MAG: ribonuclease E/G [Candidatus Liberibacter europaeus]|uniref:Ribonuclease G n=1 Tax=Candidatus Liberibacter europaeus TaxID=744859 RepID=A0A2T4VZ58_9HYPH|nr:ribonuclease E/G [Candidatus Liberibacter europaeus]PTL87056.1 MAG: ribonuclease E/G [Candidatus Liberibacter europaeus]
MANKMLIDASHVEETRVVVLRDNRVEEIDFESEHKKQIKGNIYLAKVTRVEPSLQVAFVDYGGNRHGFLPFHEIHPDYYQIPFSDRQAALKVSNVIHEDEDVVIDDNMESVEPSDIKEEQGDIDSIVSGTSETEEESAECLNYDITSDNEDNTSDSLHNVSKKLRRQYCIQEVIKNRQVLLVQIVKEERGNKGAAVTTYLSLAGRYSVLMPNNPRGESISRKVTNPIDRKNLKEIARGLEVPASMGVILRTAGASRTKIEIKRDFEYLMRLWDSVRNLALNSVAPHLVYEEGSLIKRAIRDLCGRDISEIIVSGEKGYNEARDFMKLLMPSHVRIVQPYRDVHPIFSRSGIEAQLDCLHQTEVTLPSRGYIIINQTEALVAIDVNSGRSTREHSIEDTALQTNLEAAEEIARQLRLRDLGGLAIIDFIDMEEKKNNRSVEKKLKDSLKRDRARVQVGSISNFGLLEMSRQRIRSSVLESTTKTCAHCKGAGYVRSQSSIALSVLRNIEEYLLQCTKYNIIVHTQPDVVLYLLNQKRAAVVEYENRFGVSINIVIGLNLENKFVYIEKGSPVNSPVKIENAVDFSKIQEAENYLTDNGIGEYSQSSEDMKKGEHAESQPISIDEKDVADASTFTSSSTYRRRRRRVRRRRPVLENCDISASDVLGPIKNVVDDPLANQDFMLSGNHDEKSLAVISHDSSERSDCDKVTSESMPEKDSDPIESTPVRKFSWWLRRSRSK